VTAPDAFCVLWRSKLTQEKIFNLAGLAQIQSLIAILVLRKMQKMTIK